MRPETTRVFLLAAFSKALPVSKLAYFTWDCSSGLLKWQLGQTKRTTGSVELKAGCLLLLFSRLDTLAVGLP